MNRKSRRIWGGKPAPTKCPSTRRQAEAIVANPSAAAADEIGSAGKQVAEDVGERLADGKNHFEHAEDYEEKEQRSPDAMQQNIVDLARVGGRERGLVAGAAADLRGPVVRAGRVADDGQFDALGLRVAFC